MVWLKVELTGKEVPLKPTPTGYLTKFNWQVRLDKGDDEQCYIGGTSQQSFGVRWIVTYWPVGKFKVRAGEPYI